MCRADQHLGAGTRDGPLGSSQNDNYCNPLMTLRTCLNISNMCVGICLNVENELDKRPWDLWGFDGIRGSKVTGGTWQSTSVD